MVICFSMLLLSIRTHSQALWLNLALPEGPSRQGSYLDWSGTRIRCNYRDLWPNGEQ